MRNDGAAGVPDLWSVYLAVDDAEATVARVADAGGQVMVPAMDVMALGRMAVVVDAGGAVIGMWQPGEHRGFGYVGEPGAPNWFELHARDYDASLAFYRAVFGWQTRVEGDSPEFRYSTVAVDEEQYAGVMDASGFLPEGVPGGWTVYFGVDDADHAASEVVSLGGEIVMAAEDTPYGRLATVADPTGAVFRLHQPPAS
jgi:predicted enzyme related to lactoylglutathione lyase